MPFVCAFLGLVALLRLVGVALVALFGHPGDACEPLGECDCRPVWGACSADCASNWPRGGA